MKIFLKWLVKAVISGCLAIAILTGFCLLYYNVPVHSKTLDGASDYSWEHNKFYSRGTEGFALGKTNNEGYLNTFDYEEGMDVDVLVMGSSHMEGYNVAMDESTAARLNEMMFEEVVYNIGTSEHSFLTCADNLSAAVEKYKPSKYVVIEALVLEYSDEEVQKVIDGELEELSSHSGGIVGLLQKNQYLRLVYSQLKSFLGNKAEAKPENSKENTQNKMNIAKYNEMLAKLSETAGKYGAELIVLHQNNLILNDDGSLSPQISAEVRNAFAKVCEDNNVRFLDMTDVFIKNYNETHILPHGFSNTSAESGHLNKYGHKLIAESLYDLIGEVE